MPAVREVWAEGPGVVTSVTRHWFVILVASAVLGAGGYVLSARQDPVYEAGAVLGFDDLGLQVVERHVEELIAPDPDRRLQNRAARVRSPEVIERASELLDGAVDAGAISDALWVSVDPERGDVVTIVAVSGSPDTAADIANAVAEAYQIIAAQDTREQSEAAIAELDHAIDRITDRVERLDASDRSDELTVESTLRDTAVVQLLTLANRRERLAAAADLADTHVSTLDQAYPPWEPVSPHPKRTGALAALFGAALASVYAYWREGGPGKARHPQAVQALLGVRLMGHVPRMRQPLWKRPTAPSDVVTSRRKPYDFVAVAFDHALRFDAATNVLFVGIRRRREEVGVLVNVASSLSHERHGVVLVDADLRNRRLTRLWDLDDSAGLADLKQPGIPLRRVATSTRLSEGQLTVVPAGRPQEDPYRLLRTDALGHLLRGIREAESPDQSSRVVIHSPAVLEAADAGVLAGLIDGVVLCVFRGTSLSDIREAHETIGLAGGKLLGFIFVGDHWRRGGVAGRVRDRALPDPSPPVPV